jgi:hypothetical protein
LGIQLWSWQVEFKQINFENSDHMPDVVEPSSNRQYSA